MKIMMIMTIMTNENGVKDDEYDDDDDTVRVTMAIVIKMVI
jgi:hypothetical protein